MLIGQQLWPIRVQWKWRDGGTIWWQPEDDAVWDEENEKEDAEEVVDNEFETNSEGEEEE